MTQPTTYDPEAGVFYRTFNIRFEYDGKVFETPIKAVTWLDAEYMLDAIKATGMINNELIEIIE
jgi:hypothetical protein